MKQIIYVFGASIMLTACGLFKPVALFDQQALTPEPNHIDNFYALSILKDELNSEVWFTDTISCLKVENSDTIKYAGNSAIYLKWDKLEGGCNWIGMGIGWNGWMGKDLSLILDKAAIRFKAYSTNGKITSLPLATAFEDYGGLTAWLGVLPKYIEYLPNEDWATITLPLADFAWDQFDANPSNIKQFGIQFEAAGEIYVDEIEIVPFENASRKSYSTIAPFSLPIVVDGILNEELWNRPSMKLADNSIWVCASDSFLYVAGEISDNSPFQNGFNDKQIWNGDAIEVAFSTNPDAFVKRKELLYSDQHFGIALTTQPFVWDWRKNRLISSANIKINKVANNKFTFELRIPLDYFEAGKFISGNPYSLEVAIDQGDGEKRQSQLRWNSTQNEGFSTNPSLWGKLVFENIVE